MPGPLGCNLFISGWSGENGALDPFSLVGTFGPVGGGDPFSPDGGLILAD